MEKLIINQTTLEAYKWPRKAEDNSPVEDLGKNLGMYYIVEDRPDNPNSNKYQVKLKGLILTEEVHEDYDYFLKAIREYELVEIAQSTVIANLTANLDSWVKDINGQTTDVVQKDMITYMNLDYMRNNGYELTDDQKAVIAYITAKRVWGATCDADLNNRIKEYKDNGGFPQFDNWAAMPQND